MKTIKKCISLPVEIYSYGEKASKIIATERMEKESFSKYVKDLIIQDRRSKQPESQKAA